MPSERSYVRAISPGRWDGTPTWSTVAMPCIIFRTSGRRSHCVGWLTCCGREACCALWDVVYSFEPPDAERRIEAWITETMSADVERGWTRAELAEHVRDEHSTYTWLLEPMIERAGFDMIDTNYSASGVFARYLCSKR